MRTLYQTIAAGADQKAELSSNGIKQYKKSGKKLRHVKSGIALAGLDGKTLASGEQGGFLASRTFRVLLAGAGFLADAYDLFVINLVLRLLRDEYPEFIASGQISQLQGTVASAALFGAIFGQLTAGSLADIIGRKTIFVGTAALITIGSLGSAFSFGTSFMTIYSHIALWRFVLGAGVGGEYPLAATVTSESTSAARRGSLMAAVFSMQGVGSMLSVLVVLLCLELGCSAAFAWRFSLAFGAVPAILAFPYRLRMHETETFERVKQERKDAAIVNSGKGIYGSTDSINSNSNNSDSRNEYLRAFKYYKWHMLGTASTWFLLDVVFYANGLFNHDVTSLILSNGKPTTALQDAWNSAFICLVAVPGYILSVNFMERVGRKNVQMNGFMAMGLLFLICGHYRDWFLEADAPFTRKLLFLVLYSLTFLFSNFGPNTTTFVIPGEIYPAEVRATCHGLSAASGKLGAACGAYFFPLVLSNSGASGLKMSMYLCALTAFLGAGVTYLLTPKYGSEELSLGEDNYLMLEHDCMRPRPEDLMMWETDRLKRARSSQQLLQATEVIEHSVDLPHEGSSNSSSGDSSATMTSSMKRSLDNMGNGSGSGSSNAEAARRGAKTASSSSSAAARSPDGRREGSDVEADVDEEGGLVDRRQSYSYQKSFS